MRLFEFFKRIQILWKDPRTSGRGAEGVEEPSEARFRAWVLTIAMLTVPPLLLALYFKTMFPGLTHSDALDFAQLGRNLSAGRGFTTYILRPLALTHGANPTMQPEMMHGPLYPFLLALGFGVLGVKDTSAAVVSGIFYLLTIPVLYLLGVRVFNRAVGLLTALTFTFNALMLEYAASGLHITLYTFLATSLLLTLYYIAAWERDRGDRTDLKLPKGLYLLAGVLTGLLYLTDALFFWLIPVVAITLFRITSQRKVPALLAFGLPLLALILPWMARNTMLTGNPVFGLRGAEIYMNTKGYYPGYMAYRYAPEDLIHSVGLFEAVVQKILMGLGTVIQAFPEVTASWVLAFFLPCLLFRFTDAATNTLRRVMMYVLLALLAGSLVFGIQMPLFVAVIPAMLMFAVAYLLHLTQQARLRTGGTVLVTLLLTGAVVFPLVSDMTIIDKTASLKEAGAARALGKAMTRNEVALSDQPWILAWYGDRPSLWIPANDKKIAEARKQFAQTRWMFLTDHVRGYSENWMSVYDVFRRWNSIYEAITDKKAVQSISIVKKDLPLLDSLNGFTSVAPEKDTTPSVIIAAVPLPNQTIGLRPDQNGPKAH
jgi:hypothetical protein